MKDKQIRLQEELGQQVFHYDAKDFFEPITKVVADAIGKLLEQFNATFEPIDIHSEISLGNTNVLVHTKTSSTESIIFFQNNFFKTTAAKDSINDDKRQKKVTTNFSCEKISICMET